MKRPVVLHIGDVSFRGVPVIYAAHVVGHHLMAENTFVPLAERLHNLPDHNVTPLVVAAKIVNGTTVEKTDNPGCRVQRTACAEKRTSAAASNSKRAPQHILCNSNVRKGTIQPIEAALDTVAVIRFRLKTYLHRLFY